MDQPLSPHDPRGSTSAQLKNDINSGLTGDKVGGFDPAAAPLGTDEEAGGASPTPEQISHARAAERSGRPTSTTANAAEPDLQPDARMPSRSFLVPVVIGAAAAAVLAAGLFAAL